MIDQEFLKILTVLLPGFIGASIFHYLSARPKPDILSRIVHALILTIVVNLITSCISTYFHWQPVQLANGNESPPTDIFLSRPFFVATAIACLLGLTGSLLTTHDIVHRVLRKLGLSKESMFLSIRQSAFASNTDCYVMMFLTQERRLWGWVKEFPHQDTGGHLYIEDAKWIDRNNEP